MLVTTTAKERFVETRFMKTKTMLVLSAPTSSAPIMFFFSSRRRHTRFDCDWSSDVCSSDLGNAPAAAPPAPGSGTEPLPPASAGPRRSRRRSRRAPGRPPRSTAPDHPRAPASASSSAPRPPSDSRPGRARSADSGSAAGARDLASAPDLTSTHHPLASGAALTERHARENQRTRKSHGERERLAENQPRPDHAEERYQVGDGRGARRADTRDETIIEHERDTGAQHAEQQRARPGCGSDRMVRPVVDRERCEHRRAAHEIGGGYGAGGVTGEVAAHEVDAEAIAERCGGARQRRRPDAPAGRT